MGMLQNCVSRMGVRVPGLAARKQHMLLRFLMWMPALVACGFHDPCASSAGPSCVVASIHVSASTNTAPVDVVVHADGSAERTIEGSKHLPQSPKTYPPGSAEVEQFLSDLEAAGDVTQYSVTDGCSKSVSFGTTLTLTSGTETSRDLRCLDEGASATQRALRADCNVLTDIND